MPIENYENKIIVIAGEGDVLWSPASHQQGTEVDHILIGSCEKGEIGRQMPDLKGTMADDWSVKIVLPCQKSWASFYDIMQQYAIEKWGKIPDFQLPKKADTKN